MPSWEAPPDWLVRDPTDPLLARALLFRPFTILVANIHPNAAGFVWRSDAVGPARPVCRRRARGGSGWLAGYPVRPWDRDEVHDMPRTPRFAGVPGEWAIQDSNLGCLR